MRNHCKPGTVFDRKPSDGGYTSGSAAKRLASRTASAIKVCVGLTKPALGNTALEQI